MGVAASPFSATSSTAPAFDLLPGDTFDVIVTYAPTDAVIFTDVLTVAADGLSDLVVPLDGVADPVYQEYTWVGSLQTYEVPTGVTSVEVKAWGAGGGGR